MQKNIYVCHLAENVSKSTSAYIPCYLKMSALTHLLWIIEPTIITLQTP